MRTNNNNNKNVMKKMKKGQIFSLDFLISLIALTAAIGLMIQAIEVNTYYEKEKNAFDEMKLVAETAADLLIASNETTCVDLAGNHLMNCIDNTVDPLDLADTDRLIPNKYGYKIIDETARLDAGLERDFINLDKQDFVEIKRIIFIDSIEPPETPTTLSVKVWLR